MSTISKRRRNEASILTSFSISKRNEPAYSRTCKDRAKRTLLILHFRKIEVKQILFIPQIRNIEAERTLFIPQIRKIEAKRSLFIPQIRKNEAEWTLLIPQIGQIEAVALTETFRYLELCSTCLKEGLGRSKPATNLRTSTLTHWVDFYYIQASLNCLL